jgi:arginine N-succinyltransferase
MTTLKPDRKMLGDRVAVAVESFAETIAPEKRDYMFVMEDTTNGRLAGICAIKGAVGLDEPFYNYRIGTLVHSSRELDVFTRMETLYLSNDLTGSTELCSLFLHPDYRTGNNGKLLSKSRFLFIAQFPHLFTEKLIAEMRGYQEEGAFERTRREHAAIHRALIAHDPEAARAAAAAHVGEVEEWLRTQLGG